VADVAELRVRITADASGFKTALVDAQGGVERAGHSFQEFGEHVTHANQAIELAEKVYEAFAKAIELVASVIERPIEAAKEQDEALSKLEATLAKTGQLTAEYSENLVKLADAESLVKNVSNDVVLGAEKTLVAFGAQREELPKLIDAVIDLSTKTGDVAGAAFIVGKAMQGETGTLSRYGIFVDEAASKSDKLASALTQIQARFGGQAAAAAATFGGRIGIISIAITQLEEALGSVVTRNQAVLTMLSGIASGFTKAKEEIEKFLGPLDEALTVLTAFATIKAAEGLEQLADATRDIPIVSAALKGMAEGLRDSNTASLEAKTNLAEISAVVASGARGLGDFVGILRSVGPDGTQVFQTVKAGVIEAAGALRTLTDTLNDADNKLTPFANLGANIGAKIEAALPQIEDKLVTFFLHVGEKIVQALVGGILNFDFGGAIERKGGQGLEKLYDKTLEVGGRIGQVLLDALTPSEAGAAEIPPMELTADPTQADNTISQVQASAREPLVATMDVDTKAADAATTSFFDRFKAAAAELASESFLGRIVAGLAAAAKVIPQLPPAPTGGPTTPGAAGAEQEAANRRADAALSAQLDTQKQMNAEAQRAIELEARRAELIAKAGGERAGELDQMKKAFAEANPEAKVKISLDSTQFDASKSNLQKDLEAFERQNPKVVLGVTTGDADKQLDATEARVERLDKLEPTIRPQVAVPAVEGDLQALQDRVQRLDGLAPTVRPSVDLTTPNSNLETLLAKARELDAMEPDLKVEAGKSFEDSQSSVTALIAHVKELNDTKAVITPTVDPTQLQAGFDEGQRAAEAFQATASLPATVTVDANTDALTPAARDVATFKDGVATPAELNVDTTRAKGGLTVITQAVAQVRSEASKGITVDADISRVKEKLSIIESDISAGIDPLTIDAEIKGAQAKIDTLRADIKTLQADANANPVEVQAKIKVADDAQAKLNALQAKAQEPAVKPVDADTRAALEKVAELQARADAAVAAVAHGFGAIHGEAATSGDIQTTIERLRTDLVAAIEAGDTAAQTRLRGAGAQFLQTFGPTGGLTAAERKQIQDIIGPLASVGQAQFEQSLAGRGLGGDSAIAQAMRDAQQRQGETAAQQRAQNDQQIALQREAKQKQEDANSILRTSSEFLREMLAALKSGNTELLKKIETLVTGGSISTGNQAIADSITRALAQQRDRATQLQEQANQQLARTASASESTARSLSSGFSGGFLTSSVQSTVQRTTGVRGSAFRI
jgi:hypothetical protein